MIAYSSRVNRKISISECVLSLTTRSRQPYAIDALLCDNVSVNSRYERGHTPLHIAAHGGHTLIALRLLTAGAETNAIYKARDTALHVAAS